jgi:tRNA A-37 threonylcarbamoyl transferase component Bud32
MNTIQSTNVCPKCGDPIPADAPRGLCPKCVFAEAATDQDSAPPGLAATATEELPSLARVAAAFPQLEILELIGRGGMGFVFKARQPHLERFVALKLLPDKLAANPRFTERFNREGRVLAKLHHPNIVSVFDFGRTEDFYFLTMEYVDGVNLRQAMRAGRFSPSEALAIVPKICEALQYAHEQGVLHRDIKPENILLDAKGRVKIADFGIAKLVDEDPRSVTLTGTGAALGTPHYMAPEQLETPSAVDHRADIYSLGVVFYEMLTGELPIGRFAPPSARTPVGSGVDEVVFRALEKDREKRFQSAGEVKTKVEHLTESGAAEKPATASAFGETGPHGTQVLNQTEKPTYAFRAFAGAAMVGMSLVSPFSTVVSLLTGRGGIGPGELWLALGSVALVGLGGTLVGWLALNEIRDSQGTVRGLPLALFATLTWPLLTLVGVALGLPFFLLAPDGGSGWTHFLGRFLVLLLPAGVLTFALWTVYATARWATSQPPAKHRGVLKWVFVGLLVCAYGFALVSRPDEPAPVNQQPAPIQSGTQKF